MRLVPTTTSAKAITWLDTEDIWMISLGNKTTSSTLVAGTLLHIRCFAVEESRKLQN
tara:strand:+ start:121 stop:291 length:171 start_codon:yes stop_codon:yes gene_type:complete